MPVFFALFSVTRDHIPVDATLYGFIELGQSPANVMATNGWAAALPYLALVILDGVLTFIPMVLQSRQNSDSEQARQSLIMGGVMSVFILWFAWSINSGVLIYYVTSAVWQVVQQQIVTKRVTEKVEAETEAKLAADAVKVDVVRKERKARPRKKK